MTQVKEIFNLIKQIDIVYNNIDNANTHCIYFKIQDSLYFKSETIGKEKAFDFNLDNCIRKIITYYFSKKELDKPSNHHNDIFIPLRELIIKHYI